MIVNILKDMRLKIEHMRRRAIDAFRTTWLGYDHKLSIKNTGQQMVTENIDENRYTPRRLNFLLVLSIFLCCLLVKYLFIVFPGLHSADMPLIGAVILIALLSPILYVFFYTPMVRQFNRLKRSEMDMRELALTDTLTGVYNRRGFLTFAGQLLKLSNRAQRGLILIYADLDNLKRINDDCGHEAGDRALVNIADVLKETFRNSDVIGRVGGDEFAILALEAKIGSLNVLRQRLKENLRRTKYNINPPHKLTFSLGASYYNPQNPQSIETLMKSADMLMYEEKSFRTMPRVMPQSVRI